MARAFAVAEQRCNLARAEAAVVTETATLARKPCRGRVEV